MQEMSRDGLYDMKTIHGKFPTYNYEGICVSSMPWPIHDDQSWIYFLQFARNQYERVEIYINAEKKQMVHPSQQRTSRRPPNQGTSQPMIDINVPHDVSDSDDDPDYNALSFSEHESSSEDSDDNPNEDEDEDEEEFVVPTYPEEQPIYVGRVYDTFEELKQDVSLLNLKEYRTFRNEAKHIDYWREKCVHHETCVWYIQASQIKHTTQWKVKQYQPKHDCIPNYTRGKNDKLLTSKLIAYEIASKVSRWICVQAEEEDDNDFMFFYILAFLIIYYE
ncbi:unnamed protein product, partial [Cuscuta epithymum]